MVHTYEFQGDYIAVDTGSGSVHLLDEAAYTAVNLLNEGCTPGQVKAKLAERFGPEADALVEEILELKAQDLLFSQEPVVDMAPAGQVIKAMCLHVAHDCDLRCAYCFAGTGAFHGQRALLPLETGKKALDFLIAHSGNRRQLEVDFFGGEPLMNWEVVKQLVAYGREQEKKFGKVIRFTLTTNCTALDDEKIDFLNREMRNVVLSMDGRPEVHNRVRRTREGGDSYDKVMGNALNFVRRRGDKQYYARGTFTAYNLDFGADVLHLADLGFTEVSVEPVVSPDSAPYALKSEHMDAIMAEYDKLALELRRRRDAGQPVNFFHFNIDLDGGPCIKKRLSGCGAGCEYIAVTPEGDIYPCHQFVGETDFKLGSVLDGSYDFDKTAPFRTSHVLNKPECASCWAKYFCSGGCAANAFHKNGSIAHPYALECAMERKRLECAIGLYVTARK
ncbi:MAG: thioether cross-link-forming SCIFF peptide maturase [Eubacteriales bacterium]|nr:thioether cross-link-forming SCIFF peptide maturase [Eubacteriales bacterium]